MFNFSSHPALQEPKSRTTLLIILLLRTCFFAAFVFIINAIITLGTDPWLICLAAVLGTASATRVSFSRLNHLGFVTVCAALLLAYFSSFEIFSLLPALPQKVFKYYIIEQHTGLCFAAFMIALISSWLFWKFSQWLIWEIIAFCTIFIALLAAHRHYHFDMLKVINSLAWKYGLPPLATLVITSTVTAAIILIYFFVATMPSKPRAVFFARAEKVHHSPANRWAGSIFILLFSSLLILVSIESHRYHSRVIANRLRNDVGDENREGLSPFSFQTSLGTSSQPAALVRLEGDYAENPYSPMLYLRESATSKFNGKELVIGNKDIDQDISFTTPLESYSGKEYSELGYRIPVTQSVYLLTNHKLAFGIDYPLTIVRLKTPANAKKFRSAYRVYSMAPAFDLKDLANDRFGNSSWSQKIRDYYLETPTDPRYRSMAEKITAGKDNLIDKASTIINYLNQNATYTLQPNHDVSEGEDNVAPFLFGDLRGYCVHFAHAITYMFRSLGIPARVATGYLTDLSQARDGHILLRMSDRHAWAEAFIDGKGWIPFDVQPVNVESHAETPVDMKVLEELMGLIGPGQEILPENLLENEKNIEEQGEYYIPEPGDLIVVVLLAACLALLYKLYLLFAWLLPASPARKLIRTYASLLTLLYDMGLRRGWGETRDEFRKRVSDKFGLELLTLTDQLDRIKYSAAGYSSLSGEQVLKLTRNERKLFSQLPFKKRLLAFLNPSSLLASVGGGIW